MRKNWVGPERLRALKAIEAWREEIKERYYWVEETYGDGRAIGPAPPFRADIKRLTETVEWYALKYFPEDWEFPSRTLSILSNPGEHGFEACERAGKHARLILQRMIQAIREDADLEAARLDDSELAIGHDLLSESDPLSERERQVLRALHELQALNPDRRVKREAIADQIRQRSSLKVDGASIGRACARLKKRGLSDSRTAGRDSGIWLQAPGIERARAIIEGNGS